MASSVRITCSCLLTLYVLFMGKPIKATTAEYPSHDRRILYNSDAGNAFAQSWMSSAHLGAMDPQEKKVIIEDAIDDIAAAGVDTLAVVCWEKFMPDLAPSKVCPDTHRLKRLQYLDMVEAGLIPMDIMIDRCHLRGIEFIATFRMNDRHASTPPGRFISEHPQWALSSQEANYEHEPVRREFLAFVEELLTSREVDGIQFDYMRFCHVFEAGEGETHAHLLTDFTRKARALLDAAAKRRGRSRLVLGVRVPQTLEECRFLGFDVASWIKEGLVDWVVPSDFFYTDFNARTEEFVALTEGTECKIYPAIHPIICRGNDVGINALANYRAAARNFYAYGAHGLEAYNYQYHWGRRIGRTSPWSATLWPAALGYLGKLADPQEIAGHDRHYRFYRLWDNAPTNFSKDDRIKLDRGQPDPQGTRRFRLAEDLSDPKFRAVLQFKAVGLVDGEALEVKLNGTAVPARWTIRKFYKDGQNKWQGRPLGAFYEYTIDLGRGLQPPPTVHGDNKLYVRLTDKEEGNEETVTIDELEVYVYVTG